MPDDFKIGKNLSSEEDSLFDAIAQVLNRLANKKKYTVKSLRDICYRYIMEQKNSWIKEKIESNGINYKEYKEKISFTSEELDAFYSESGNRAIKGCVDIEGRIICEELNVGLRIITINEGHVSYKDIKIDNSATYGTTPTRLATKNVIHIAESENSFFPVTKSNPTCFLRFREGLSYNVSNPTRFFAKSKKSSAAPKEDVETGPLLPSRSIKDGTNHTNSSSEIKKSSGSKAEAETDQLLHNESIYGV